MGSSSLAGMLEHGTQEQALRWHLTSNHYPPLPSGVYELAKTAIRLANAGRFNSLVNLKNVCTFRGATKAPVYECVKAWHLDQFIGGEE